MNKFTTTLASAAAALLLAGNAMAQMPAAGEAPFADSQVRASTTAKTDVARTPVSITQVATGEMSGVVQLANDVNRPSRAEVRQQTREAIAHGIRPSTGERS